MATPHDHLHHHYAVPTSTQTQSEHSLSNMSRDRLPPIRSLDFRQLPPIHDSPPSASIHSESGSASYIHYSQPSSSTSGSSGTSWATRPPSTPASYISGPPASPMSAGSSIIQGNSAASPAIYGQHPQQRSVSEGQFNQLQDQQPRHGQERHHTMPPPSLNPLKRRRADSLRGESASSSRSSSHWQYTASHSPYSTPYYASSPVEPTHYSPPAPLPPPSPSNASFYSPHNEYYGTRHSGSLSTTIHKSHYHEHQHPQAENASPIPPQPPPQPSTESTLSWAHPNRPMQHPEHNMQQTPTHQPPLLAQHHPVSDANSRSSQLPSPSQVPPHVTQSVALQYELMSKRSQQSLALPPPHPLTVRTDIPTYAHPQSLPPGVSPIRGVTFAPPGPPSLSASAIAIRQLHVPKIRKNSEALYRFCSHYMQLRQSLPGTEPSAEELTEMAQCAELVMRLVEDIRRVSLPSPAARPRSPRSTATEQPQKSPLRPWEGPAAANAANAASTAQSSAIPDMPEQAFRLAEDDMETIRRRRAAAAANALTPSAPPIPKAKQKKRLPHRRVLPPGKCHSCSIRETPEWRRGPDGSRTLCNACGLHYAKLVKKQEKLSEADSRSKQPIDIETLRAATRASNGHGALSLSGSEDSLRTERGAAESQSSSFGSGVLPSLSAQSSQSELTRRYAEQSPEMPTYPSSRSSVDSPQEGIAPWHLQHERYTGGNAHIPVGPYPTASPHSAGLSPSMGP